jgi:hypothetical protein
MGVNTSGTATSNSWYSNNQNSVILQNNNLSVGLVIDNSDKNAIFSRDLDGFPFGTHDGVVIYNEDKNYIKKLLNSVEGASDKFKTEYLGGDLGYAIVTGVGKEYNGENLTVLSSNEADIKALKEYTGLNKIKWYKSDFDTQVTEIKFNNNLPEFENDKNILSRVMQSDKNLKTIPQKYQLLINNCIVGVQDIYKNTGSINQDVKHKGVRPIPKAETTDK